MHLELYISLRISEGNTCVNISKKKKKPIAQILMQIIVITVSCLLSWLPSSIVFVVMMFKQKYPIEIIILIIVCVVPINSVVGPVIFIATNLKSFLKTKS